MDEPSFGLLHSHLWTSWCVPLHVKENHFLFYHPYVLAFLLYRIEYQRGVAESKVYFSGNKKNISEFNFKFSKSVYFGAASKMQCEWRRMRVLGSWWGRGRQSHREGGAWAGTWERGVAGDQMTNGKCEVWERRQRGQWLLGKGWHMQRPGIFRAHGLGEDHPCHRGGEGLTSRPEERCFSQREAPAGKELHRSSDL